MLQKLANIFRIPDLRKRILFTLAMLAVYRLGGHRLRGCSTVSFRTICHRCSVSPTNGGERRDDALRTDLRWQ